MTFIVEIDGSCSGTKSFIDRYAAKEYFQFLLIGLEYMQDDNTNVRLLQVIKRGSSQLIRQRFQTGKPLQLSWLTIINSGQY